MKAVRYYGKEDIRVEDVRGAVGSRTETDRGQTEGVRHLRNRPA